VECTASSADRKEPSQIRLVRASARRRGSRISDTHLPHFRIRIPLYRVDPLPDIFDMISEDICTISSRSEEQDSFELFKSDESTTFNVTCKNPSVRDI